MTPQINRATADQLASFFRRADTLYEERERIAEDLKELWKEAKGCGFDVKTLDTLVKLRRKDPENEKLKESVVDTYIHALALDDTPLGQWARERMLEESRLHTQAVLATQKVNTDRIVSAYAAAHGLEPVNEDQAPVPGSLNDEIARSTVSINGGPEVPLATMQRAVARIKPSDGSGSAIAELDRAVREEMAAHD